MTAQVDKHTTLTFNDILDAVKMLTPAEQARLRAELASMSRVHVVLPDATPEAVHRGQKLADQLRQELQAASLDNLDDVMSSLRGREWSS